MSKRTQKVSSLIGMVLVLALALPLLVLAEIKQVRMGVDGMI